MGRWELYGGNYIFESYYYRWADGHLGYSKVGIDDYRRWLREDRGYSLADLGIRWYGDPHHHQFVDDILNVAPYIESGRPNRIERWPEDSWNESMLDDNIVVGDIKIGCEAK